MRTIKISAMTMALMAITAGDAEALKKTYQVMKRPPKSAPKLSSEGVSESILFALLLPLYLADISRRHPILYEGRIPVQNLAR